jgi:signal transduction histidine kinase
MTKHYSITSVSGETISINLANECKACFNNCITPGALITECPKYGGQRRQGKITNSRGTTFLCDQTKTTKLFRNKLEALSYAYHDLLIPKSKIENETKLIEQKRMNRLVHNLTSINAHNIQELYDLVPQDVLSTNYQKQLDFIQKEIKRDSKKAALMFIRIAKHNIHMKSEFSIYKKLDRNDAVLELSSHPIRKVILNILHTFFVDFTNNEIYVSVSEYTGKVNIDYESIQVALYHLIENASKYTMPNSNINITFSEAAQRVIVSFKMRSLHIAADEKEKIFTEGYSGKAACNCLLNGDGIGMWQIEQMVKLNNGQVSVNCGQEAFQINGIPYADNEIILTLIKAR